MKKWSEIRQGIINKLFMDEEEVNSENENYASKFAFFANECLVNIANGVKPRIGIFRFGVYDKVIAGSDFKWDSELGFIVYNDNGINAEIIPEKNVAYVDDKKVYVFDDGLRLSANQYAYSKKATHITMPDDFLSYADMINYHNNEPYSNIIYLTDRDFLVDMFGNYVIYYNALWEPITEDYMNDQEQPDLPIDQSVLNCIPSYVAAQILAEDDVQRSTILKNEYELMLSRLDTNIMYQSNSFKSIGGWY